MHIYFNQLICFKFLVNFRKEEARVNCEHFEHQQTELINQLRNAEDSRQPFFARKKEIQGSIMKFQNRQQAHDKMVKDIEFKQSELKTEKERTAKLLSQNSVCLLLTIKYLSFACLFIKL